MMKTTPFVVWKPHLLQRPLERLEGEPVALDVQLEGRHALRVTAHLMHIHIDDMGWDQ